MSIFNHSFRVGVIVGDNNQSKTDARYHVVCINAVPIHLLTAPESLQLAVLVAFVLNLINKKTITYELMANITTIPASLQPT